MESVLTAIVIIFILLFAVFTLSNVMISTQDMLQVSVQDMQDRLGEQARTWLVATETHITSGGTLTELVLRNDGSTRLTDFDRWDMIIQYYDGHTPEAHYHVLRLPYQSGAPGNNEWTVAGIFLDADTPEVYEPDILNPGESLHIQIKVSPSVGPGQTLQAILSVTNGVSASAFDIRNIPPTLAANAGLTITSGETGDIHATRLQTTDADGSPDDLVYTVVATPAGLLNLGDSFTQTDIDRGLLNYTSSDSGSDSFNFTVTDGEDTIGPYTFVITVNNAPPVLATNIGLTLPINSSGLINESRLQATDIDNPPDQLVYTVTTPPAQGTLSLGATFTQADISSGLLTYTHTGAGHDTFAFTVSDGQAIIGSYWFNITVQ
ncbi:MAG: hypothetical protein HZC41_26010 [Chloroflexi bacterium]|nr:hypothetical protein [Chloroflexota bacterium]